MVDGNTAPRPDEKQTNFERQLQSTETQTTAAFRNQYSNELFNQDKPLVIGLARLDSSGKETVSAGETAAPSAEVRWPKPTGDQYKKDGKKLSLFTYKDNIPHTKKVGIQKQEC